MSGFTSRLKGFDIFPVVQVEENGSVKLGAK